MATDVERTPDRMHPKSNASENATFPEIKEAAKRA
jgi:hypothetical protein